MPLLLITAGLVVIVSWLYYRTVKAQRVWKERGVTGPEPHIFYGNMRDTLLLKTSIAEYMEKIYNDFPNEKMVGIYARTAPILILRDPNLIKDVLIKDFSNFASRGLPMYEKVEPLSQHLFMLEPKRWRPLRIKLSPVFTSGKLREMFFILTECCQHFGNYLEKTIEKNNSVEVRELSAKFTTDVIGSAAFGLEMNALSDKDSEFRRMGREIFSVNTWRLIKMRIREILPIIYTTFWWLFYDYELNNFFINSVKETMRYREEKKVVRNDFIDILREIKAHPEQVKDVEISDGLLTSQAFVFFVAGFETSSSTISHAIYELAQNHEVQEKLYQEIMQELKRCNGSLVYESIKNMKYMHKVFQETLRLYPPVPFLMRQSKETYSFSGISVTIPAEQNVWIPIYGIQRDPKIFPDPTKFDPERFDEANVKSRHSMYHIPFGDGPRNCIGERFAVLQTKSGLVEILKRYRVDICEKTTIPYVHERAAFLMTPKGGTWVKFIKRE